jgi:hypothetical protein
MNITCQNDDVHTLVDALGTQASIKWGKFNVQI